MVAVIGKELMFQGTLVFFEQREIRWTNWTLMAITWDTVKHKEHQREYLSLSFVFSETIFVQYEHENDYIGIIVGAHHDVILT